MLMLMEYLMVREYISKWFKLLCLIFSGYLSVVLSGSCFAESSTDLIPRQTQPQTLKASVDTNDCEPLDAGKYVIVLGNGGTNMKVSCPSRRPVMLAWEQELGFGGFGAVSWGGGEGKAKCCAVRHDWVAVTENS
jgi:hypothetical protein